MKLIPRFKDKPQNEGSLPDIQRRDSEFKHLWSSLRSRRLFQVGVALCVGLIVGASAPFYMVSNLKTQLRTSTASQNRTILENKTLVESYAGSCASTGTCQVYPLADAERLAQQYALTCFNFSADTKGDSQPKRLANIPGPDCGWQRDGNATPEYVVVDSSLHVAILDANNTPSTKLGVVGVKVKLIGQPDVFNYIVPIAVGAGGTLKVAAPGSIVTSRATLTQTGCSVDSSFATGAILKRLQSLEAGRTNAPNVNPADSLVPKLTIANYGESIKSAKVLSVKACMGTAKSRRVIANELIAGPVPGSHFVMTYAYDVKVTSGRDYVQGWGPVIG